MPKHNTFITLASYVMALIGAGALLNSMFIVPLVLLGGPVFTAGSNLSSQALMYWVFSLFALNAAQLFFGLRLLHGRPGAYEQALQFQLAYAIIMEGVNGYVARGAFLTSGAFLGVLIVPAVISGLLFIGSRHALKETGEK